MNAPQLTHAQSRVEDILARLGFTVSDSGYERGEMSFTLGRHWSRLARPSRAADLKHHRPVANAGSGAGDFDHASADRRNEQLCTSARLPGLWKSMGKNGSAVLAFHLPSDLLVREIFRPDSDLAECSALQAGLEWALSTVDDALPATWEPPAKDVLEALVPGPRLVLQNGGVVRQIEVVATAERLTLKVPILTDLPATLPLGREKWLDTLLDDAERLWPLLRTAHEVQGQQHVIVAEVDLSGVPKALAESLILAGLDSLRWAVERLAETADLLVDPTIPWEALSVCITQEPKEETSYENNRH